MIKALYNCLRNTHIFSGIARYIQRQIVTVSAPRRTPTMIPGVVYAVTVRAPEGFSVHSEERHA